MWHTTTKDSIYGYNCPHFTMGMWITPTNYTKANGRRDEYNWLHCKTAKRKQTRIDTTTLPVDFVVKWSSRCQCYTNRHGHNRLCEVIWNGWTVESRSFMICGRDIRYYVKSRYPATGSQTHIPASCVVCQEIWFLMEPVLIGKKNLEYA